MRDLYIKNGQGFVVVYAITSQQTFHDIKTMRDQIIRVKVGNKSKLYTFLILYTKVSLNF